MQQDRVTLKQYLRNRHNSILYEAIQLSKIGHTETQLIRDLNKYKPERNL